MTPSPLVPVEGALARPRVAPLDNVPSFGREWTFRGAPGARPDRHCLATLTTSCIDVDRPHRTCRWPPRPVAVSMPISAGAPVVPAAVAGARVLRTVRRSRDRRATYAICWSIGALGIIGWLIAAHEPPAGFGPTYAIHAAGSVPDHATSSGTVQVATVRPRTSTSAPPRRTMAAPVATMAESPQATHHVTHRPTPLRLKTTSNVPHTAAASLPRSNDRRSKTAAPARPANVSRLAARPPIRSSTLDARTRDQLAPASRAIADTRDTLDDPLTLIAMASALRATEPARATHAPAAGFDWSAQLSHRRLTDTPDAFAR